MRKKRRSEMKKMTASNIETQEVLFHIRIETNIYKKHAHSFFVFGLNYFVLPGIYFLHYFLNFKVLYTSTTLTYITFAHVTFFFIL